MKYIGLAFYLGGLALPASANSLHTDSVATDSIGETSQLKGVEVTTRRLGVIKGRFTPLNTDIVTGTELLRAACCNLGESFTTNPSMDVNYNDAATGARQIKLLGLAGTYVQMLTENIPDYRGAVSPYALSYIPGPWLQSIQVSTGAASVKNGYESITGQVDVELKKPQLPQRLDFNAYANSKQRYEANFDGNVHLNNRLSTGLLAHYENATKAQDMNKDGFTDMPMTRQYNLLNRWMWMGNHYILQAVVSALGEKRQAGQYGKHVPSSIEQSPNGPYRIGINTDRYSAFVKQAYMLNTEHNTNLALILSGSLLKQDAAYGLKDYHVNQKNGYASLIFETEFTPFHKLSTGISLNHDYYKQDYRLENQGTPLRKYEQETVPGAYVQYTYNLHDKLVLMGGARVDHSDLYGTFFTPRMHVKFAPNDIVSFRLSAGKGYRTPHILAEQNYWLAGSRKFHVEDNLKQEEAWNYGISSSFTIPLFGKTLNLNAQYYYTDFRHQVVTDLDKDPHAVYFENLRGKSYSHTFQVDATYPFFQGFTLTGAYRLMDVKSTYNGKLQERPLASKFKGLITASYKTPLEEWQFDLTWQINGGGRMPLSYTTSEGNPAWASRFGTYHLLNAQITRFFKRWSVYLGGENITNFRQRTPIIAGNAPWGQNFDSNMIWGPVEGATYYIGFRLHLFD